VAGAWTRLQLVSGLLAPLVFTTAWIVAGAVQSDYSPRREDLSALAAESADRSWIMIAGLIVTGALMAAFAPALRVTGSRIGPVLVVLAGLGVAGLGLLRNDCSSRLPSCEARVDAGEVSWHHTAHDVLSAPVFALAVAVPLVVVPAFRRTRALAPLAWVSIPAALVLAGLFVTGGVDAAPGWHGVIQRVAVSIAFLWLGAVALRLLSVPRQ
jgi:hypothetical protein